MLFCRADRQEVVFVFFWPYYASRGHDVVSKNCYTVDERQSIKPLYWSIYRSSFVSIRKHWNKTKTTRYCVPLPILAIRSAAPLEIPPLFEYQNDLHVVVLFLAARPGETTNNRGCK